MITATTKTEMSKFNLGILKCESPSLFPKIKSNRNEQRKEGTNEQLTATCDNALVERVRLRGTSVHVSNKRDTYLLLPLESKKVSRCRFANGPSSSWVEEGRTWGS